MLEQDPTAGEQADEGSTVTLSVSSGPGVAEFRVAGLTERDATELRRGPVSGSSRSSGSQRTSRPGA